MPGLLEDLGQGLQGAGAILSDRVYDTQARERAEILPNLARRIAITKAQRELQADEAFSQAVGGMQAGGMTDSASMMSKLKDLPLDVLSASPKAHQFMGLVSQVKAREDAAAARKDAITERANNHLDVLEQRRIEFDRRSEDKAASELDRAQARAQSLALQKQIADTSAAMRQQGIDLARDRQEETKRHNIEMEGAKGEVAAAKQEAAATKANQPVQDIISDIDQALKTIQQNPGVTGARGMFSRGKELVTSELTGDTNTPANDFQSQILQIQSKWRKLPTIAANRFKSDAGKIDQSIKGLGIGTNDAITVNNLTELRASLVRGLEARGGEAPPAPESPQQSSGKITTPKQGDKATSKSGKPMSYDGQKWVYD